MHVPRRIPRTDPAEDMHGQLLVVRRGRGHRLGAVIARRLEGDDQRRRDDRIVGHRDGRTMLLLTVRGRATLVRACSPP